MGYPAFFSIIIPTYNRPQRLRYCLDALLELDYPRDRFEIIIVDDGSKTALEPIVRPFCNVLQVNLLRQDNAGPASARNTGAQEAKGTFLAFTDDDCLPAADWLTQLAAQLEANPRALVGGLPVNALPKNLYSTASQELIDYLYQYYNLSPERVKFFASNNIALPRDLFLAVGGFDKSFPKAAAEDREFCDRWQHLGYPMIYAPEVTVYHAHSLTLRSFCRQHFYYGRGAFHFHQVRARRQAEPIRIEPLEFYKALLRYPLQKRSSQPAKRRSQPAYLVSALFVLSQAATIAGFFWEKGVRWLMPLSRRLTNRLTNRGQVDPETTDASLNPGDQTNSLAAPEAPWAGQAAGRSATAGRSEGL
ncbi:MAG TPA: glycosyltransferase [Trichocoleus sp.]